MWNGSPDLELIARIKAFCTVCQGDGKLCVGIKHVRSREFGHYYPEPVFIRCEECRGTGQRGQ